MKSGVSLVICCHNSAGRLPETLRHIAAQQVPADISWEVLIVDNASTDDTAAVAQRCWPSPAPASMRIVRELKLGLANARFRSYSEARFDLISFIDDDNWVGPTWVANVIRFFEAHPEAVAVGGPSRGAFETSPPGWFSEISPFFALGVPHEPGDITDQKGTWLWGAGMSVRREKGLELLRGGFHILLCGGDEFSIKTGEDTELCFGLRALGGRLFFDSSFEIEHFMPSSRLTWPNALKLMHAMGEASPILELYGIALDAPSFRGRPKWKSTWPFFFVRSLRDLCLTFVKNPAACVRKSEGSKAALEFERNKGKLATMCALFGRFRRLMRRIREADWAKAAVL